MENTKDTKPENVWDKEEELNVSEKDELLQTILNPISLYDTNKTKEQNFEDGVKQKFLLLAINKDDGIVEVEEKIPTAQDKIIVNFKELDKYNTRLKVIPVDYDSIFGVRLLSFMKYDCSFFCCDERVLFEAFLIKYRSYMYKTFYWSRKDIMKEVGVKKDRATTIISKFKKLGIFSTKVKTTNYKGLPSTNTHFELNPSNIIKLSSRIFTEEHREVSKILLKKHLSPGLRKGGKK